MLMRFFAVNSCTTTTAVLVTNWYFSSHLYVVSTCDVIFEI
jgi:hypothetical protein